MTQNNYNATIIGSRHNGLYRRGISGVRRQESCYARAQGPGRRLSGCRLADVDFEQL